MPPYYLTTPIYYVNDLPHIGHIFTTVVADTLARYRRMSGDDVRFLTGTDEHGQNIERAAAREGVTPQQLADRVVARYHELWKTFGISHDDFIRTTEPRHERGVLELIRRIEAAGDLYLAKHEGWYCSPCELFYTEKELAAGQKCPVHGAAVEWHSEENVFFRLAKYQQPLLDWIDSHPEAIRPETRRNEVRSFVESGLRDLSVSRTGLDLGSRSRAILDTPSMSGSMRWPTTSRRSVSAPKAQRLELRTMPAGGTRKTRTRGRARPAQCRAEMAASAERPRLAPTEESTAPSYPPFTGLFGALRLARLAHRPASI